VGLVMRAWDDWESSLVIVKPETSWLAPPGLPFVLDLEDSRWDAGPTGGSEDVRELIGHERENPGWGAPLSTANCSSSASMSETSVSKYLVRARKPPSQTWVRSSIITSRAWYR